MALGACSALGCGDKKQQAPQPVGVADAAASAAAPIDHLAKGELAEGKERAFGLVLPKDTAVVRAFPGVVHIRSQSATPEQLTNYVRARVVDGSVVAGAVETRFVGVKLRSDPTQLLSVEIRTATPGIARSEMVIRDATPLKLEPGLSEADSRKSVGLDSRGKLADPKHME